MLNLIIPLGALLLSFLSSISAIRFFLSRNGRIYWIIPFLISVIFFYQNLSTLIVYADTTVSYSATVDTVLPLVLAILWYAMINAFHFALKTEREYNKYTEESRRTYNEARFINLMEKRQTMKEKKEEKIEADNRTRSPSVPQYTFPPEEQ